MPTGPGTPWHELSVETVVDRLESDLASGLARSEAEARLARMGPNVLAARRGPGALARFLDQFAQPLVIVLLVAGGVTAVLEHWVDSAVILAIVVLNAIIGFVQESKALRALDALARTMTSACTVLRDGETRRLAAADLVPGDVVLLDPGDKVPADLRVAHEQDLHVDESALTGESVPVRKRTGPVAAEAVVADRTDMAYASTLVTHGRGTGVVTATGDATEVGRISRLIAEAEDIKTPLTQRIAAFSRVLVYAILALAALAFGLGLLRGDDASDTFMAAVALAVGAIPEGLPAAVTIILAIGVSRMAARRAIIRRLPAVETLGSTTVICSDKTGTLTRNEMTVRAVFDGERRWSVGGVGYVPEGAISPEAEDAGPGDGSRAGDVDRGGVEACLRCGLLCNDSRLVHRDGRWEIEGDPTEAALLVSARKLGLRHEAEEARTPRIATIPFESRHRFMATMHDAGEGRPRTVWMKGAPEAIVERCDRISGGRPLDPASVLAAAEAMAAAGMRVLAFARGERPADAADLDLADVAGGLELLGLQAMIDPPRPEAQAAVAACRRAGIRVRMITGDHATTGAAIAREIGIVDAEEVASGGGGVLTGAALAEMDDEELAARIEDVAVFGRVSPEQKLRLVKALQTHGHIVAMTGDGVNDAPALKQANIGVAMGASGTEVAREASDMVLTDDNFATIQAAVEEGRAVFDNLRKFIVWTLPTNAGEGLVILAAILTATTLPLLPVQILWINMTTAALLGITLAFERHERDLMDRPPRDPKANLLSWDLVGRILLVSAIMLAGAFWLFHWELGRGSSVEAARTAAVNVFIAIEAFYLLNCRSLRHSILKIGLWSNPLVPAGIAVMIALQMLFTYAPFMHALMQSAPIDGAAWARILGVGAIAWMVVGVEKWLRRRFGREAARRGRGRGRGRSEGPASATDARDRGSSASGSLASSSG